MRFNPLHCGAVVALDELEDSWEQDELVSIPFIAGQWSLPRSPCGGRGGRRSFNPLHCGAVVALMERRQRCSRFHHVSIPFIAGQWSLNFSVFRWVSFEDRFQSPSLRGSGRSSHGPRRTMGSIPGFNPLHCGAVVAQSCSFWR